MRELPNQPALLMYYHSAAGTGRKALSVANTSNAPTTGTQNSATIGHRKSESLYMEDGITVIGRKLVRRIIWRKWIRPVYPKSNLQSPERTVCIPYLLKNLKIDRPNQVWSIDIDLYQNGQPYIR